MPQLCLYMFCKIQLPRKSCCKMWHHWMQVIFAPSFSCFYALFNVFGHIFIMQYGALSFAWYQWNRKVISFLSYTNTSPTKPAEAFLYTRNKKIKCPHLLNFMKGIQQWQMVSRHTWLCMPNAFPYEFITSVLQYLQFLFKRRPHSIRDGAKLQVFPFLCI